MSDSKVQSPSGKAGRPPDQNIPDRNIQSILELEKESLQNLSAAERLANSITRVAGSTPFIVFHLVWFVLWIFFNSGLIAAIKPMDAFPFSFLTFIVSLEAIFLSLLVLMTQNRMTRNADKRAHLDLQINMLAEQESTATLQMLEKIAMHLGIHETAEEARQLEEVTDVTQLSKKIDQHMESEQ